MKKFLEVYYVQILKPSLTVGTIFANYNYMEHSNFINEFFYILYIVTFMIKPIFYFSLRMGMFLNAKERTPKSFLLTMITVFSIFLGLPVKEYFDFFESDIFDEYFGCSGYLVSEYNVTHFIANVLIENVPIISLVYINNCMLGKFQDMYSILLY
jgi:hypothetical protein